ncbi:MAG: bifunctional adenosylcobinamide kinase/adenosylcobinamide-phosphate guanylyltransferase [Elusimicrobiota bacterium]
MGKITFITGGIKSGKTSLGMRIAKGIYKGKRGKNTALVYLATGVATDGEFKKRIELHRKQRKNEWVTIEEPVMLKRSMESVIKKWKNPVVLIDCINFWVANMLEKKYPPEKIPGEIRQVCSFIRKNKISAVIISNETGMCLVSPYKSGRVFQDVLGRVNAEIAGASGKFFLCVSGKALRIK